MLIARHKRAEAQQKIHETMSGLSDTSAFDTFDRMASKVDEKEAQAAASVELAGHLGAGPDRLDDQFRQLEAGGAGGDAALLELKQKMGLLPAPGGTTGAKDDDVIDVESDIEAELRSLKEKAEP